MGYIVTDVRPTQFPSLRKRIRQRRDDEPLLYRRTRTLAKRAVQRVRPPSGGQPKVLLVVGCQRSGTTMLQQSLFDRSWRTICLEEHDRLIVRDEGGERLRLRSNAEIASVVSSMPFDLVVMKPLADSHRTSDLLDALDGSKAIWMLRNYSSVAHSNVSRFGPLTGTTDLQKLLSGDGHEWRAHATGQVKRRVADLLAGGLSPIEAAAVFWWARNQLYFDQQLHVDDRVRVLRYETLVGSPVPSMQSVGSFLEFPLPLRSFEKAIRPSATSTGSMRTEVDELCASLLERFDGVPELGS